MMGLTTMIGDVLSSKNSTGHLSRDPMAKKWRGSLPFHEVCPKERSNRSWNGSLPAGRLVPTWYRNHS